MKYDPKLDMLLISTTEAQNAYFLILYTLKHMRLSAGLPLDKYDRSGMMSDHDHAAVALLEVAETLGINVGVSRHDHNRLDLREVD